MVRVNTIRFNPTGQTNPAPIRAMPGRRNNVIAKKVTAFIKGLSSNVPPPFKTKGGRVLLCTLSDGKDIFLPTSYSENGFVVVKCVKMGGKISVEVYNYRRWSTSPLPKGEVFLVKEGKNIYLEAIKVADRKPEKPAKKPPATSGQWAIHVKGAQIAAWWKGETDMVPGTRN